MSLPSVRVEPGTVIGPYLVERALSPLGTSARYVARAVDGERVVVEVLGRDAGPGAARARIAREIRALGAVDHPHLARTRASGEDDGQLWIAFAYAPGTDLARVLAERGPLPVETALAYAIQAAEGLAAAHGAGLVHRDLTPAKLRVAKDGRIVVVGFGLATHRPDMREGVDGAGPVEASAVTPYVAPEQIEHDLADERSDVWALGCVLYELLVGQPPFGRGGKDTTVAILRDEPPWSDRLVEPVVHVISSCLRKSSFARVGTMRELLGLLRDAAEDIRAVGSRRPSSPPRMPSRPPPRAPSRPPSFPPSLPPSVPPSTPPSVPPSSWSPVPSRPPSAQGHIKGTAIRAGLTWFAATYGESVLEQVGAHATPELHAMLRLHDPEFGVMPSGWYDTALIGELLELLDRAAAPADPEILFSKFAHAIAHDNVAGVYRSLFRLVSSPPMLEAHAQRVWRTYVDEGKLAVHIPKPGSFEAHVTGWAHHHSTVCRFLRPMLEHLLRAVGYVALVVDRTQCVSDGDPRCALEGNWVA